MGSSLRRGETLSNIRMSPLQCRRTTRHPLEHISHMSVDVIELRTKRNRSLGISSGARSPFRPLHNRSLVVQFLAINGRRNCEQMRVGKLIALPSGTRMNRIAVEIQSALEKRHERTCVDHPTRIGSARRSSLFSRWIQGR